MSRIKWYYENVIRKECLQKFQFSNFHQLPKLESIHLNISQKHLLEDKKKALPLFAGLELISGQKMKKTYAKKSIATFKLRKNQLLGAKCTLRRHNMLAFFEKFCYIVLPKRKEFEGFCQPKIINDTSKFSGVKISLNCSGDHFLLYPELESFFEIFESIKGFHISISLSSNLPKKKVCEGNIKQKIMEEKNRHASIMLLNSFLP